MVNLHRDNLTFALLLRENQQIVNYNTVNKQ
jgi:hypothetical protein